MRAELEESVLCRAGGSTMSAVAIVLIAPLNGHSKARK